MLQSVPTLSTYYYHRSLVKVYLWGSPLLPMQVTNDAKIENRYGSERPVMRPLELRPCDLTFDKLVRGSKERPAA
jgi:hypothetical protein